LIIFFPPTPIYTRYYTTYNDEWPERLRRPGHEHSNPVLRSVAMSDPHVTAPVESSKAGLPPATTPATPADSKPAKPSDDFPLFAHAAGVWAKKIRGKLYYFGPWSDPQGALRKYKEQAEALHAGRKPRPDAEAVTVRDVCNAFLNHKQALVDAGELSPRTWAEYKVTTDLLVSHFGRGRVVADVGPDDFAALRRKMAARRSPVCLGNDIQRVRSVFKHAFDADLIDRAVRFGPGFARPSKKVLRLERARRGPRMFEAEEIRRMLAVAGVQLKAMILLGVNCGYGNADCGTLPLSGLDLERGWAHYHRPKTGIDRRCPLWPETVDALRAALAKRSQPKDEPAAGLVFVTKYGFAWFKGAATSTNPLSAEMRKLLDALVIDSSRNFYALRHTFETIGGEAKDQVAVDYIMGHALDDMATVYRERISDERLKAVTDHVRAWLFPSVGAANKVNKGKGRKAADDTPPAPPA
jgi:integrase